VGTDGEIRTAGREYGRFTYRGSYFKTSGDIVAEARFTLTAGDARECRRKVDEILTIRRGKHPVEDCSAGCFFKNVEDPTQPYGKMPAGRLLEEIGAKRMAVGGAKVFERHANIIMNAGSASSHDIRALADLLKQKVYDKFGIMLQEEVIQLGNF
ncbi:MAG TPA: hypothetical protein VN285_03845, partial [Candidatus Deferrimicrobium sp.]|nr:hypothetical protein [Candidatus Deferrimicrobium sp.]